MNGDPHTLVLRQTAAEPLSSPFGPLFDLLPGDEPVDTLAVTYRKSAQLFHNWHDRIDGRLRNVGVVSVGEQMRSTTAASSSERTVIQGVADSSDTDRIRDTAEEYLDAWPVGGQTVTYFDSVTTLVESLDADAAIDFLRTFLRVLDAHNAVGYFCLTPAAHDQETVREIASLFDTVVERVGADAEASPKPSVGDCFHAVANSRRLRVVYEVAASDDVSIDVLADRITARESADREQVLASLIDVHLPKLTDLGVVAYDRERGRAARGEHFDAIEPYLRDPVEP